MLKIQPEITTKDLSHLLEIRQQSLNELLNKLEKGGYVERRPSETDKRVMVVHLTEMGEKVQQPRTDYQEILGCLSQEELQQFGNYLNRIIVAFQTQAAGKQKTAVWAKAGSGSVMFHFSCWLSKGRSTVRWRQTIH